MDAAEELTDGASAVLDGLEVWLMLEELEDAVCDVVLPLGPGETEVGAVSERVMVGGDVDVVSTDEVLASKETLSEGADVTEPEGASVCDTVSVDEEVATVVDDVISASDVLVSKDGMMMSAERVCEGSLEEGGNEDAFSP